MTFAATSRDLNELSDGGFILGMGTQVKAHIERRYGLEWSKTLSRTEELVAALRAIWRTWNSGDRLDFQGEFYRHTLMTPTFTPRASAHADPKIYLAAVGEKMTDLAGRVADGFLGHSFTTTSYLKDVTLLALQEGIDAGNRSREDVDVVVHVTVATGDMDE